MKITPSKKLGLRLLFVAVTGASISLSQAEDENALHKECFKQGKGRSCVRLGTALWQSPSARPQARAAFAKGCELKIESACTLKDMPVTESVPVAITGATPKVNEVISGIEKTGPSAYKIQRAVARKYAGDLQNTLNSADMEASKDKGKIQGYRFKSIEKGSVFEALGFMKNDLILKVNEQEITSPAVAMDLLPQLLYGPTDKYAIQMVRGGKAHTQNFQVIDE